MNEFKSGILYKTLIASAILTALSVLFFFLGTVKGVAVLSGTLLSSIFIVSGAFVLDYFSGAPSSTFTKIFFFSTAVRFILVLFLFGILIGVTKINEIYFTVSFIISYLCLSVTEMIFINKILQ